MTATAPAIDVDALLRRLHLPTVRRLYPDLAQRAEQDGLGYRDFLALLMAEEVAHRTQTRIQRCVRRAHFPFLKTIDEYDFTLQAGVRLALLGSALSPEFVTQGHTLIFSGPSGTGKTHLAIAVAYRAIQNGFDALFTTATALIEELSTATREGKLREPLVSYTPPSGHHRRYLPDFPEIPGQIFRTPHVGLCPPRLQPPDGLDRARQGAEQPHAPAD